MNNDLITILGFVIGILGLVATLVGTYFTYISFINPITRFKKYLKNPENWEKFQGIENHLSFYRHKKYPNFQIVIDWDKELVENFRGRDELVAQGFDPAVVERVIAMTDRAEFKRRKAPPGPIVSKEGLAWLNRQYPITTKFHP